MMKEWKEMIFALAIAIIVIVILLVIAITLIGRCMAQEGCGRWMKVERADGLRGLDRVINNLRFDRSIRRCTYWMFSYPDDLPPPDSVWLPEPCPKTVIDAIFPDTLDSILKSFYINRSVFDSIFLAQRESVMQDSMSKGFWEFTYPLFVPSGDTFIVEMQDSLWITGERPRIEDTWYGWKPWGIWWFLRPEER